MAANLYLTFTIGYRDVEADGSPCCLCGDAMYLRSVEAVAVFPSGREIGTGMVLCGSCGDALREGDE